MTKSFDELRIKAEALEKIAKKVEFLPPEQGFYTNVSSEVLLFEDVLNEYNKLYKVKAAKKYLIRK